MFHIRTPSRLHLGLMALGDPGSSGVGARAFGGAGLMVTAPGVELSAHPASRPKVAGEAPVRVLDRTERLLRRLTLREGRPIGLPLRIELHRCAPEHSGLGVGTQLSLAVAKAVAHFENEEPTSIDLADRTGRGRRSAIGIHGFDRGGFLVDGGKAPKSNVAPLVARMDFPDDWPILLALPRLPDGLHGAVERQTLSGLPAMPLSVTEKLARLLVTGMLPALAETDYAAFAPALHEYNRRVGECFLRAQDGGAYSHPLSTRIVEAIRQWGVPAVGQSSWGPTLFVVTDAMEKAIWVRERLEREFGIGLDRLILTEADNVGAKTTLTRERKEVRPGV